MKNISDSERQQLDPEAFGEGCIRSAAAFGGKLTLGAIVVLEAVHQDWPALGATVAIGWGVATGKGLYDLRQSGLLDTKDKLS